MKKLFNIIRIWILKFWYPYFEGDSTDWDEYSSCDKCNDIYDNGFSLYINPKKVKLQEIIFDEDRGTVRTVDILFVCDNCKHNFILKNCYLLSDDNIQQCMSCSEWCYPDDNGDCRECSEEQTNE